MTHYRKSDGNPPFLVPETEITNLLVQAKIEDYKFIRRGVKFAHKIHKIPKNATGKNKYIENRAAKIIWNTLKFWPAENIQNQYVFPFFVLVHTVAKHHFFVQKIQFS